MAATQILLSAVLAAAVTAAPQGDLPQDYIPPPPPETYLPPDTTTTPSPEYLPPLENEYLPPPPSNEYLPPPVDKGVAAEGEGNEVDTNSIVDSAFVSFLSENTGAEDSGEDSAEDSGEDSGEDAGEPEGESGGGQSGGGNFDDGQYHPEQYNSGKYDPDAGKYQPNGDDGSYRPNEQVTFPPIEDFEFAYAVKDKDSGNDYAVSETNKGGAYKILLPDGRTQIVQYVIDSRGIYRSKISYLQPDGSQ